MKHVIKTNSLIAGKITATSNVQRDKNGQLVTTTHVRRHTSPLTMGIAIGIIFFVVIVSISLLIKLN